jgi:hypothetical protein
MDLAPDVVRMMRERSAGEIWLTLLQPGEAKDLDDVARIAGLEPLGRAWVEVDITRARHFLVAILHKDLAYNREVMTEHRATWLADEFLRSFGKFNSRFATNSPDMPATFPFSWTPATEFTFDAGIAIMGEAGSGVYWVADED